ncbi:hypothetical protein D3874_01605 [Oleomonas cavernae]|uniref:Uncharacterized protein n=1 Tax=Oleomonas cavernae TaxID=2320859 RepID=A0A418WTS8_9PROT|nr:DUF6065 family protein [Oleomonas cavernae]RJF94559.1 hypothetical protein D3874_01605 [Oleomonas cavernae]
MRLVCYTIGDHKPLIRVAPATRDWMDGTPLSFAYRCLPLNIANAHGWELLCPARIEAVWNGGKEPTSVKVTGPGAGQVAIGHFGSGILTFHVHSLFVTEPGWNLYVTGSPNEAKHGLVPLTGIIETDWSAATFTMNWRFTAPGIPVVFEEGEPFAFLFPVPRGMVEAVEPEVMRLADEPDLLAAFKEWSDGRNKFLKDLPVQGTEANRQGWQKTYFQGRNSEGGKGIPDHQTKLKLKPFGPKRPKD